jgi:hypothetical protein
MQAQETPISSAIAAPVMGHRLKARARAGIALIRT